MLKVSVGSRHKSIQEGIMKNQKICLYDLTIITIPLFVTYILRITTLIKIYDSGTTHIERVGVGTEAEQLWQKSAIVPAGQNIINL